MVPFWQPCPQVTRPFYQICHYCLSKSGLSRFGAHTPIVSVHIYLGSRSTVSITFAEGTEFDRVGANWVYTVCELGREMESS